MNPLPMSAFEFFPFSKALWSDADQICIRDPVEVDIPNPAESSGFPGVRLKKNLES
jgi:hypothetical protein